MAMGALWEGKGGGEEGGGGGGGGAETWGSGDLVVSDVVDGDSVRAACNDGGIREPLGSSHAALVL